MTTRLVCPYCGLVYDENHPVAEVALLHAYENHLDVHMVRHDQLVTAS